MTQKITKSLTLTTALAVMTLTLSACGTTSAYPNAQMDRSAQIADAIRRAEKSKGLTRSLKTLEYRYKKNPDSEMAATEYAHALRKNDMLPEAATILAPFGKAETSAAPTRTEYAAILLEQGRHKEAEKIAQKAVLADPDYDRGYHVLGIALDAQGMHEASERAFRKGLDLWQGDPTTIMNNLALNLAAQNHLEEAAEILQKARTLSPDRREIERNLRIITALQQSHAAPVPKPQQKPDIKP